MTKKLDLGGKVFGRLTVLEEATERGNQGEVKWTCLCECGKEVCVTRGDLRSGNTLSCGCYKRDVATKHGLKWHPLYKVYLGMLQRCFNSNRREYTNYGGRGISVCDRWKNSFKNFYDDVVSGYKEGLQLDRIDNDGNYELSNIRWATRRQNLTNRGSNVCGTSKYKGVFWDRSRDKWCVQIMKDDKTRSLGRYLSEEDAARAYNEAAKELFGEYAYLNKID